jgi:hypothetical protein
MHGTITGKVVKAFDKHRLQMARDHFWYFRTLIHPKMLQGWFQYDAGQHQWSAREREDKIKPYAQLDDKLCPNYQIVIEQEPGSGGLESADSTIRNLAGYRVIKDKVRGSKDLRAEPFAAQVQSSCADGQLGEVSDMSTFTVRSSAMSMR